MNAALEIAGFHDSQLAGWMCLDLETPTATLHAFASEEASPQLLFGVQGEPAPELVNRVLATLDRLDVRRATASAFALPAAIPPFDTLGFVRGPERRLLRGILEDDAVLQAFPMYACELTNDGRLPNLPALRRWTNLLSLDRPPQPWFQFRMHGRPSGLDFPQWGSESWSTFEDYLAILSRDAESWLEVRNRKGRILRLPDGGGWDRARERVETHVCRDGND
jgi:hypothetical protein